MFGLSTVLMLYGGPAFFKKIDPDQTNIITVNELLELKLNHVFNGEDYMQFSIIIQPNDTLTKNYYLPEKEYTAIEEFLVKNRHIKNKALFKLLPIVINKTELKDYKDIKYRLKNKSIELLSINNHSLIGRKTTALEKIIYYLLGGGFSLVGLLAFLLSSMVFFDCIKTYQKTGVFPDLPNSIGSKVEGLKYVFRGFKSKKLH
ncbi:hypothetical protein [Euzebyella saccharophila]|uniref:EF-hand domain-containing protein n=1 Tax=Euzebyella saccharophila TaxID=679664 RepID=A0ABV8JQZ0_9FLAO|nr:hypothetical protein [Euzebyella saccharophila]